MSVREIDHDELVSLGEIELTQEALGRREKDLAPNCIDYFVLGRISLRGDRHQSRHLTREEYAGEEHAVRTPMARLCVPTVMSGVFYIGLGEDFDAEKVIAYPPGSVVVLPGDTWHFHWAKSGEYVTQVSAIGPLGLEYLDAHDDPRNSAPRKLGE
jgi:hypothetical protein